MRLFNLAGKPLGEVMLPGLGTSGGFAGRFDRPEIFYDFTSALQPSTVFRYDLATGQSPPFDPPR